MRQRINNLTVPATAYNACFLDSMSPGILGKKGPDVTFGFEVHDGNMTLLPFAHAHFVQPPSCFISFRYLFAVGHFSLAMPDYLGKDQRKTKSDDTKEDKPFQGYYLFCVEKYLLTSNL